MGAVLYLAESAGPRILAVGDALTQATGTFALDVTTWDLVPAGEVGDVLFRSVDCALSATNGYAVGITPIVDGVDLTEQTFAESGTGEFQVQAFVAMRGTRLAARVRTLSRTGDLVLHTVRSSFLVIRQVP